MNLRSAEEGKEYIIKRIETDDEELESFLFSLGCYSGEKIHRFISRHRKLQLADSFETANAFFFSYIARIIGIIPCDVVSAYCGIKRLPVTDYLAGSVLGMLPGLFENGGVYCHATGFKILMEPLVG